MNFRLMWSRKVFDIKVSKFVGLINTNMSLELSTLSIILWFYLGLLKVKQVYIIFHKICLQEK